MSARALALAGILALLLLQWRWHTAIAPPTAIAPWLLAVFYCIPMLPCLWLLLRGHRAALLVGAIAALLYFCHGVMFATGVPALRGPAIIEVALSVIVVVASSWGGLRARFARKPDV
ncbi:MAG TPA: DUF2069 domain-containing protein [Xanthomonadaceae bacterium]